MRMRPLTFLGGRFRAFGPSATRDTLMRKRRGTLTTINAMARRPLGSSRLMVTRLGLGLAALGRPGYMTLGHGADLEHDYAVAAMEAHACRVLDSAWAAGIRYFDAARSYGRAEDFLGRWLVARKVAREDATVGSKWGYTYTAGWQVNAAEHEVKQLSVDVLRRQWGETQAALPDRVNLYQVHSATLESGVLEDGEVLRELARLRQMGVHIGLTLSGAQQAATLARALAVRVDGVALFESVQATWNLLEPSVGPALAAARAHGVGVIVKEALANGRLTARNTDPTFADYLAQLSRQAARLGCTVDALALAAVLANPWADVVLSGAATAAQVDSNVQALDVVWDAEAAAALTSLVEEPAAYWATRGELTWN